MSESGGSQVSSGSEGPQITNPFQSLIPENGWHPLVSTDADIKLSCALLGLFCGITACMIPDAVRQTRVWKPPYFSTFKILVWLQICSATAFEGMIFAYVNEKLSPTFGFFFVVIIFWCLNSQCVIQVQANRISILVNDPALKRRFKLTLGFILFICDIIVLLTWLPVNLQIKSWASVEPALLPLDIAIMLIIATCDLASNIWFVRTIRARLVALGLRKYDSLVQYNIFTLAVSLCLDGAVIGMMFYQNAFLYMALFPLIYQIKLNIELGLSELIVRVASEKTVHRVKGPRYEEMQDPLAERIDINIEEKVESVQEAPLEITPTFGQLIKRPEWANKPNTRQQAPAPLQDEEKKGYEMQSVPVALDGTNNKKDDNSSNGDKPGSTYSLE